MMDFKVENKKLVITVIDFCTQPHYVLFGNQTSNVLNIGPHYLM